MIIITMLDGENIEVHHNTVLVGIDNASDDFCYYLQQSFIGTRDRNYQNNDASKLSTVDERLGIGGFLLSHKMFTVDEGLDKTIYFTSAVKSISVS